MTCPSHPPSLTLGKEYKLWSSLLCSFLQLPLTSSLFDPNIYWSRLAHEREKWQALILTYAVHQISIALRLTAHRIFEQIAIVLRGHCSWKLEAEIIADNYAIKDHCSIGCLYHWEIDPGNHSVWESVNLSPRWHSSAQRYCDYHEFVKYPAKFLGTELANPTEHIPASLLSILPIWNFLNTATNYPNYLLIYQVINPTN
jgi:hypothetical protein